MPALGQLLCAEPGGDGRLVGALRKGALNDGAVDEVLHARGEVAVEEGVTQHARIVVSVEVKVALQDHAVLGEGPGLVGAQHVDGAQVLDGVQALDDDVVPAEVDGALAQAAGHQHGQHLGRETHGHGQREEQRGKPVSLGDAAGHEHDGQHDGHEAHEQAARGANALVKGGLALAAGKRAGGLAEHGAGAGGNDHAAGVARDDGGAHEGQVGQVREGVGVGLAGGGAALGAGVGQGRALLDGLGLPGEGGLAHKEVACGKDAQVSRDDVSGREVDHVAHDDLVQGDGVASVAVSLHVGEGLDHLGKGLRGHGALLVLDKAQHAGDQHHDADDEGRGDVAAAGVGKDPVSEHGDKGDEHEDVGEGVREGGQQAQRRRPLGRLRGGVGAPEGAGLVDLPRAQALLAGVELTEELGGRGGSGVTQPLLLAELGVCLLLGVCGHAREEGTQRHGAPRNPGNEKGPPRTWRNGPGDASCATARPACG